MYFKHNGMSSTKIIQHVIASCPKLAQITYKHRNDQVAKIVHQELVKEEQYSPYYKDELQVILENDKYKLLGSNLINRQDCSIQLTRHDND